MSIAGDPTGSSLRSHDKDSSDPFGNGETAQSKSDGVATGTKSCLVRGECGWLEHLYGLVLP